MLRKHLSLFLALLMIFTVIPEASLAENGADEPEDHLRLSVSLTPIVAMRHLYIIIELRLR